jgi:hypothetical protein
MSNIIKLNIDVTKIDKSKLYKGEKGTYLNAALIPTPESQYGDFMIVEDVTKEEREAGTKGTKLGNAKYIVKQGEQKTTEPAPQGGDDLPF